MDCRCIQTVAFVPMGQIDARLHVETRKHHSENVGPEHAIAVVISEDRYPLLVTNCGEDAIDCFCHPGHRQRIGKIVPGWRLNEGIDVLDSATDEDIEQWLAQKHCPSSWPTSARLLVIELRMGLTRRAGGRRDRPRRRGRQSDFERRSLLPRYSVQPPESRLREGV